jgi:four helix bundle protein
VFDFEKLFVYKKAIGFVNEIYILTREFPKEELFGITGQLRRASVSVALNIAEGSGRSKKEFKRFLIMARASVHECVAILEISSLQGYITKEKKERYCNACIELAKMLSGLMGSLKT